MKRRLTLTPMTALASPAFAATDEVKIDSGGLKGVISQGVMSFKGVPYGAAPVGDLRRRAT